MSTAKGIDREDYEPCPPNHRKQELFLIALWALIDTLPDWLCDTEVADHGGENQCDCGFCEDARTLLHLADIFEGCLGSVILLSFPEHRERMCQESLRRKDLGSLERRTFEKGLATAKAEMAATGRRALEAGLRAAKAEIAAANPPPPASAEGDHAEPADEPQVVHFRQWL